jgi:hypothetical protein
VGRDLYLLTSGEACSVELFHFVPSKLLTSFSISTVSGDVGFCRCEMRSPQSPALLLSAPLGCTCAGFVAGVLGLVLGLDLSFELSCDVPSESQIPTAHAVG